MGHEKSCTNLPGPSGKAKYWLATDREQVPRGKGEKNRIERSEIEHETMCLQAIGALLDSVTVCLLKNEPASYLV